jgi:hypothetical protein
LDHVYVQGSRVWVDVVHKESDLRARDRCGGARGSMVAMLRPSGIDKYHDAIAKLLDEESAEHRVLKS